MRSTASTPGFPSATCSTWYKDAVIYELHVRSFFDSNRDGIGDFPGLTQKLDYFVDLGVSALWLLPFYPSPLRDGGYDICDYRAIDPAYGTMHDWRLFLSEAHARGLRVITEMVVNHTSDQHPWFQRSRRAPEGSRWRDYYVWSQDPQKYRQARVIFKDFEISNWTWDPVAGAYFWHRFYSHQPDLNFASPAVRKAIIQVIDFWFEQGVDGFRLDAVPYLFEEENTSCENLPATHEYLKELRSHVDSKFKDRVLLAEANQWPEEAVNYFGQGDECHMAFHFPLMPRLFMGMQMEDKAPILDILQQTPSVPDTGQWALFLRNHDELTLEMVTDEERDYMYRVFARESLARLNLGIRRRLAPLLGNDRRRIELLNLLLFSMPGTPVLYYGDEIGMGDNIYLGDRDGVRTPMQWNSDKNAGFSRARPSALRLPVVSESEYHYESVNVEAQRGNENSLYWWTKRMINLRKRWKAFGRGSLEFVNTGNRRILAFIRRLEEESVLVAANLSRLPQVAQLRLESQQGARPVELRGNVEFPPVGNQPYMFTFGPYAAFWFWLKPAVEKAASSREVVQVEVAGEWNEGFKGQLEGDLFWALKEYLSKQSWFLNKERRIEAIDVVDWLEIPGCRDLGVALVCLHYLEGEDETYALALSYAEGTQAATLLRAQPAMMVARVFHGGGPQEDAAGRERSEAAGRERSEAAGRERSEAAGRERSETAGRERSETAEGERGPLPGTGPGPSAPPSTMGQGVIYDGILDERFWQEALVAIRRRRIWRGEAGVCRPWRAADARKELEATAGAEPYIFTDRSNSCVVLGGCFFKFFRKLEQGTNPEIEVAQILSQRRLTSFPALIGAFDYENRKRERMSLGMASRTVADSENAWAYTQQALGLFWDHFQADPPKYTARPSQSLMGVLKGRLAPEPADLIGSYGEFARLLGQRTGELHEGLAEGLGCEGFTPFYLRSLSQSQRNRVMEAMDCLRRMGFHPQTQPLAMLLLEQQELILLQLKGIYRKSPQGCRIRCHGSFRLQEVLTTGKEVFFIDFEGDPSRPASERRIKRPPEFDLARMIFSFYEAAQNSLDLRLHSGMVLPEKSGQLQMLAESWAYWTGVSFLEGYCQALGEGKLSKPQTDMDLLLNCHLLDRGAKETSRNLKLHGDGALVTMETWAAVLRAANG